MTKITWLGEAEGPPSCTWNGITFPAGEAVEVTDPYMIGKARGNRFFEVGEALAPAQAGDDEPKVYGPPPVPAYIPPVQWREPDTEADPKDVSFFDDPPEVLDTPPDYPPEDNPDRLPLKRKRGRPPKVKTNGN